MVKGTKYSICVFFILDNTLHSYVYDVTNVNLKKNRTPLDDCFSVGKYDNLRYLKTTESTILTPNDDKMIVSMRRLTPPYQYESVQ